MKQNSENPNLQTETLAQTTPSRSISPWNDAIVLLESMVEQQQRKVMEQARALIPGLTADDILNPHDFALLQNHSHFQFEDGILAGYRSALIALRRESKGKL